MTKIPENPNNIPEVILAIALSELKIAPQDGTRLPACMKHAAKRAKALIHCAEQTAIDNYLLFTDEHLAITMKITLIAILEGMSSALRASGLNADSDQIHRVIEVLANPPLRPEPQG